MEGRKPNCYPCRERGHIQYLDHKPFQVEKEVGDKEREETNLGTISYTEFMGDGPGGLEKES